MRYADWGYDSFLTRTILTSPSLTPAQARASVPMGSLGALSLSTPMNATTDIVFSSTDNDTAAWTTGTINFADGSKSATIKAGNTGDITATTYVYYHREKPLDLQTATDPADAAGEGKLLIAIVEKGATGKKCKITPTIAAGLVVSDITADQITAGTITVTEIADATITGGKIASTTITGGNIATSTITADKLSVTQLDAVAANTGTLTVDETISVGNANVKIDGVNKRIIINDGTNDRVLIGYQSGGF